MKKITFSLLLLLTSLSITYSQSPLPAEGMETWDDLTPLFEEYETSDVMFPDSLFLTPKDAQPFLHIFLILFGVIDVPAAVDSIPLDRLSTSLIGMDRFEPGHQGEYALKIGGGTIISGGNFVMLADMDELNPSSFSYYYKHAGSTIDTFHVFGAFGDKVDSLNSDYFPNDGISLYFEDTQVFDQDDTDYTWVSLPMTENNLSVVTDSVFIFAGFFQQETNKESYLLLDGFQWDIETATFDENNQVVFRVGQSVDNSKIFPYLNQEDYHFVASAIIDESGAILSRYDTWQDVLSINHLPQGKYFYQVMTDKGMFAKTFIRIH